MGEGPLQPVIRQQVSQLGLEDKVVFLGTRNDVHVLLSAFDVMLFPSLLRECLTYSLKRRLPLYHV